MTRIPSDGVPESSLSFLADPYRFIGRRAQQLRSDVFATRLLGRRTVCLYGPEAARLFYDTGRMQRARAMPRRVIRTLLGAGGVQGLDGAAHRKRKAMFLELATGGRVDRLLEHSGQQWTAHAHRWRTQGGVCLYRGAGDLLAEAAFAWVGLVLDEAEARRRTPDVVALFDGAGAVGARHWKARLARMRLERWLAGIVEDVRRGRVGCDPESPLAHVARHLDVDGQPLDPRVAAVEVLNLVRPVVAVSVYICFVAHALHRHPEQSARIGAGGRELEAFVQEVRRFYPFFPAVAARTCSAFTWNGLDFPDGVRVMLDLYGTGHDPRYWRDPATFDPRRFEGDVDTVFSLIPQGGGIHAEGHRCPGEWITMALMRQAAQVLGGLGFTVEGEPEIDFRRLPALPDGGMRLRLDKGDVGSARGRS